MASMCWVLVLLAAVAYSSADLGTPTSVEEYPSLAQVESSIGDLWMQQCVATVITSYHVLSTARCFSGEDFAPRYRRIRAGSSYRGFGGAVREITSVYLHPNFGLLQNDGDLAVVRLTTAFTLGDTIQQAQILGEGIPLPTGLQVQLVSWGATAGGPTNFELSELNVYTINNDDCMETYYPYNIVTENMICTGLWETQGRDLDSADEGAPLFFSNVAVGVVSFGVSNADDEIPVVSTAIGSYTNWIIETARY